MFHRKDTNDNDTDYPVGERKVSKSIDIPTYGRSFSAITPRSYAKSPPVLKLPPPVDGECTLTRNSLNNTITRLTRLSESVKSITDKKNIRHPLEKINFIIDSIELTYKSKDKAPVLKNSISL